LESEADKTAVFYLLQSGINPEPFGEFLFRLSKEEELPSLTEWVSTHPDSEKRSIQICNWAKEGSNNIRFVKILSMKTWKTLQQAVSDK
jgi:peptidase, M48 (ste24 endopeptidase) family protein